MEDDIRRRIMRIYAAVGEVATTDTSEFEQEVLQRANGTFRIGINFQGKLSADQMANQLFSAIHNIANLKDHLKSWARKRGFQAGAVEAAIDESPDLQLVMDLANSDKHGPARDGGRSKLGPSLSNIARGLKLGDEAGNKGTVTVSLSLRGPSHVATNGPAEFIVNADVVDSAGHRISDVRSILKEAIICWETLLKRWSGE